MIRQKENIVKPQVVAGRVFRGTSFISKPEAIVFKVSYISDYNLVIIGLQRRSFTYSNYTCNECFFLVQFFQVAAITRHHQGLLSYWVYSNWKDVGWSLNNNHNYFYTTNQQGYQFLLPNPQWNRWDSYPTHLHLQKGPHFDWRAQDWL